ncbi:hypothetical protein AMTR_s00006p00235850 [Amborella trichopoda]|uniref:Uncharacterized protein n=1 Tax=Amborella trichopoda TaxID=13333 RepID=W1PCN9_AMBTC|nr:hypothetical protein AMTR_s00006p00235850 [Amborella trichopoda]
MGWATKRHSEENWAVERHSEESWAAERHNEESRGWLLSARSKRATTRTTSGPSREKEKGVSRVRERASGNWGK